MSFSNKLGYDHYYLHQADLLNNMPLSKCKAKGNSDLTRACMTSNYHVLYVAENSEKMSGDKTFCLQEQIILSHLKFTLT